MTPRDLLAAFDTLAEAPHGIAKLRDLVLALAVRGQLSTQESNAEPAATLLRDIRRERNRLVSEGCIRKPKAVTEVRESDVPFAIPDTWAWTRLGEITNYGATDKAEPSAVNLDTWVLELEDVEKTTSRILKRVRASERHFKSTKNLFLKGDVVYGKLRPYLDKVVVADEDGVCTTEMIPTRGFLGIEPGYLRVVMKSPYFLRYATSSTHGMNLPRLSTENARLALFPLPPTEEQLRIVAKVDELMALLDRLVAARRSRETARTASRDSALAALRDADTPEEVEVAWARIAERMGDLFTKPDDVPPFRDAVLELSVRGRLVPQSANEAPASELLKQIGEEKIRLRAEGLFNRPKALPVVSTAESAHELHEGWEWIRLGTLVRDFKNGLYKPSRFRTDDGTAYVRMYNIQNGQLDLTRLQRLAVDDEEAELYSLGPNQVLVNRVNSTELVGKAALIQDCDEPMVFEAMTIRLRFVIPDVAPYVNLVLMTPRVRSYFQSNAKHALGQSSISQPQIANLCIPCPPMEMQRRIVGKVDELFGLLAQFEESLVDGKATHDAFAAAAVHHLDT